MSEWARATAKKVAGIIGISSLTAAVLFVAMPQLAEVAGPARWIAMTIGFGFWLYASVKLIAA